MEIVKKTLNAAFKTPLENVALSRVNISLLFSPFHSTLSLLTGKNMSFIPGMPSPGKGSVKGGGGSPLLTKIQLGDDTYTIGWLIIIHANMVASGRAARQGNK